MIVFLIHQGRATAGALSRVYSIPLLPELGKVVAVDALTPLYPFTTLMPPHTPLSVHQNRLLLRL